MADEAILRALGIDPDEGLTYCADDPDFYVEMLGEFAAESRAGLDELDRCYAARDWHRYGIRAHSVKSTSRMIGAADLSELAREMEQAAKEDRADEIAACHAAFVSAYRQLVEGISGTLD